MNPILLDIPTELFTQRLHLRIPQPGDGAVVFNTVRGSLPELKKWMPWATDLYSLDNAEEWVRRAASQFHSRQQLGFVIFDRETNEHVGNTSAFDFDWNVPKAEIGYWLSTPHCGKGLMTEAVIAVTNLLLDNCKLHRVQICADARNTKTCAVAQRAGYQCEGTLRNDRRDPHGQLTHTRLFARLPVS